MPDSRIPADAVPYGPGLYASAGSLHVDAVELCLAFGIMPTPEAQSEVANLVLEVALEEGADFLEHRA